MKKFVILLMFLPRAAFAQSAYYGVSQSTTTGKATLCLSGQMKVAASSATASTATIILQGNGGRITANSVTLASSATASAFFGDGSHLSGIPAESEVAHLASTQSFTGKNTFVGELAVTASSVAVGPFNNLLVKTFPYSDAWSSSASIVGINYDVRGVAFGYAYSLMIGPTNSLKSGEKTTAIAGIQGWGANNAGWLRLAGNEGVAGDGGGIQFTGGSLTAMYGPRYGIEDQHLNGLRLMGYNVVNWYDFRSNDLIISTQGVVVTPSGTNFAADPGVGFQVNGTMKANYGVAAATGVFSGSVTASAFYGDGSHLSNLPGASLGSTQTFTGINTFSNVVYISSAIQFSSGSARGTGAMDLQACRDGSGQVASGSYSALLGGCKNTASGAYAFANGYQNNATNTLSAVVGGGQNTASGQRSFVAAGQENVASGYASFATGAANEASNSYAFAAGRHAKATAYGSFAFCNVQDDSVFTVNQSYTFGMKFQGGYWLTGGNIAVGTTTASERLYVYQGNVKADYGVIASTGVFASSVTASAFFGNGSQLSGIPAFSIAVASNTCGNVTDCYAYCPSNHYVLGGGCKWTQSSSGPTMGSYPDANSGWHCQMGLNTSAVAAYVICGNKSWSW